MGIVVVKFFEVIWPVLAVHAEVPDAAGSSAEHLTGRIQRTALLARPPVPGAVAQLGPMAALVGLCGGVGRQRV